MAVSSPKSYNQLCPLANALDHVGDRWSMLIVRELLGGPARFGELRDALDGIASNLLTTRLRRLEASGVIEHRRETASAPYALTPLGHGLRPALEMLGLWGAMVGPIEGSDPQPLRTARSTAMGMQAMMARGEMPVERRRVEIRFPDGALTVAFGGGEPVEVRAGTAPDVEGVASTTLDLLRDLPFPGPGPDTFVYEAGSEAVVDEFVHALRTSIAALSGA